MGDFGQLSIENKIIYNIRHERMHSASFYLSVLLLLYFVAYIYLNVVFIEFNDVLRYGLTITALLLITVFAMSKLLFVTHRKRHKDNILLVVFLMAEIIIYLIIMSGLERLLYINIFIISIMVFKRFPLRKHELDSLFNLFIAIVILVILVGSTLDNMNVNRVNPNTCGLLLMLVFSLSLVRYRKRKSPLQLLICIVCFGLQFVYKSRVATVGSILFFLSYLVTLHKKSFKTQTVFLMVLFISVISIIGAYIYSEVLFKLIGYGQIKIGGKDLFTGRQSVWKFTLESVRENFWFGVGSDLNTKYAEKFDAITFLNAHNQPLGILACFGVFVYIIFYIAFAKIISSSGYSKSRKYVSSIPVMFILILMLMDMFETNLFHSWAVMIAVCYCLLSNYCIARRR